MPIFNQNYGLMNSNAPGSPYAIEFGHQTSNLFMNVVKKSLIDLTPQQYYELALTNMTGLMQGGIMQRTDEEIFFQYANQRRSLVTPVLLANIASAAVQVIPVINPDAAQPSMEFTMTDETRGTVDSVDVPGGTVTLRAHTNYTLPALAIGGQFKFPQSSQVSTDGTSDILNSFRLNQLIEKKVLIQLYDQIIKMDRLEEDKYNQAGTTNYLVEQMQQGMKQYMMNMSIDWWTGQGGEANTYGIRRAKTMQGWLQAHLEAGGYQTTCTPATVETAVKDTLVRIMLHSGTRRKFAYMHPKWIIQFQDVVKRLQIRFKATGDDSVAFTLTGIDYGQNEIMLVPKQAWDQSSNQFHPSWENRIAIVDHENTVPAMLSSFPEKTGEIGHRGKNPYTLAQYTTKWIEGSYGVWWKNKLGDALITINP